MPVRALVEASRVFGIGENSLRVALARLLAQDRVTRDERGRYRIGPGAGAMRTEIRSWRRLENDRVDWQGGWVAVHGRIGGRGSPRAASERALRLLGFQRVTTELAVRPDNLVGSVSRLRERLHALGLTKECFVSRISEFDALRDARIRGLWADSDPGEQHRETRGALETSRVRLERALPEVAMAESFLLGGRAIRQLVHDPLLPESMASGDDRRALIACLGEYDTFGRRAWSAFLERHGVAHLEMPADVRAFEDTLPRAAGDRA